VFGITIWKTVFEVRAGKFVDENRDDVAVENLADKNLIAEVPVQATPTRKEEFRLPQKTKLFPGRGHQLLRRLEDAEGSMRQI
jgi:hypothetical protein